jgi:hypothetical protein
LRLRLAGEWLARSDVGCPDPLPTAGARCKSGFSDALKRAACKWGLGRYLRRIPASWVDYDPATSRLVTLPRLPVWALPAEADAAGRRAAGGREEPDQARAG